MNKVFYALAWFTILSAIGLMLLVSFWYLYPYKIITFIEAKFPIVTKEVNQGGFLKYVVNYCKYTDVRPIVSRSFVNGIVFTTPLTLTSRQTGCNKMTVGVKVPEELPRGIYHIEMTYQYKVNPLREITLKHSSDTFEVLESTKSATLRLQNY